MASIFCCFPDPIDFDADVNLFHFDLHRAIGKGAFGKVRVVEHKRTKKVYALKYIDKARCVKQKAVANIIQERQLLEEVDHHYIVNLRYAFQDDANCFFALDLMLGGDLRFHLERKGSIPEDAVRFWVAELSLALAYLHKQRIIHRDIKPDNILLDSMGHAHITDFNVAIHYSTSRQHTSVAGSLAYMAPEVCTRKGYSWQCDWWSLGVCAYELMFGRRPFEGRSAESLTKAIGNDPLRVPERASQICSTDGLHALKKLLERNTKRRLGCSGDSGSLNEIKQHPWFSNLFWDSLEAKDAQSPFVPDMRKANFDISHELDEFLMVEKPLTATKRKQNVDYDKLKPEYRQLEEQFTNFDFTKPKRMSYYPHNQPISVAIPNASRDPEDSIDIPRSSSQSMPNGRSIAQSREQSRSPSKEHSDDTLTVGGDGFDGSRAASPDAGKNMVQMGQAVEYMPPAGYAEMPSQPDRAYTRQPTNADGGLRYAAGQNLPRLNGPV